MRLVLSQDGDPEGPWIAEGLRARGDEPVVVVTSGALVHDTQWEHRVGQGRASFRLVLGDGTEVDDTSVTGVVNRLYWLTADGYEGASPVDREYANAELFALGLSWLESLGPRVLNRPNSGGILGAWRTTGQWRWLARSVGLPIVPFASDDPPDDGRALERDRVVLVIDGAVIEAPEPTGLTRPDLAPRVAQGLRDLLRGSGLDLIEARFTEGEGVAFRDVAFLPNLYRFGEPALDAVHRALGRRSELAP